MALDAFALILAMLALGLLFQRFQVFGAGAAETLNRVVLYVCLPAAVLRYAPQLQLGRDLLAVAAVPWLLLLASVALVSLASRWLQLSRERHAVLLLTVALGNTSFLGYPLVRALLGDAALPYAVIFDQFGAFLILSTFGLYVLARYGGRSRHPQHMDVQVSRAQDAQERPASRGTRPSLDVGDREPTMREIALRIVRFPPFVALLIGLTVMPAEPPSFVANGLQRLADALLPLAMLAIGLSIQLVLPREELRPLALGLSLKLVVMPLLALLIAPLLGMGELAHDAVVLEAAMPPMITAGALAIAHGLAPRLAAAMVGYGILLSLLTLPVWAWLLTG